MPHYKGDPFTDYTRVYVDLMYWSMCILRQIITSLQVLLVYKSTPHYNMFWWTCGIEEWTELFGDSNTDAENYFEGLK